MAKDEAYFRVPADPQPVRVLRYRHRRGDVRLVAEIIYRYPSKVPYGYVEVKFETSVTDPKILAEQYIEDFTKFRESEAKALDSLNSTPPKSPPAMPKSVDEVLDEDEAKELIKSKLGATEVDGEEDAPWNNKPEAEEKPYVTPASEDDWDF